MLCCYLSARDSVDLTRGPQTTYACDCVLLWCPSPLAPPVFLGVNLKVLVVDVHTCDVAAPVSIRAEQSWSVQELKTAISEKCGLPLPTMRVALETYQNEGKLLSVNSNLLKTESFRRKHTVSFPIYYPPFNLPTSPSLSLAPSLSFSPSSPHSTSLSSSPSSSHRCLYVVMRTTIRSHTGNQRCVD